jgi:autotransporter-associated beta strand protein
MKNLTRTLQTAVALAAMFALPHMASAARTFSSVTVTPNSTNITQGAATTNVANIAIANGSGGSTRFVGTAQVTTFITPSAPTISATVTGTNYVYPAATTTYNFTLTTTTTASTPAGTYVISVVADTNSPYAGDNITPVTNTFTLNVGAVFVPQKVWSPAGANTNWSTPGNWTASGVPTPSNDVQFVDLGAVGTQGQVDNVVDSSLLIGSLTYGQTNNFHTTQVPSGVTLKIGGTAGGLNTGTGNDPADGQLTTAAMTGAGTVSVTNKSANVNVTQSHVTAGNAVAQSRATLDMSGLDNFNATISRLFVGVDTTSALRGASGALSLAKTNTITLTAGSASPQIDVGDNSQASGSPAIPSTLLLGQTNGIFADSIAVGRGKTDNLGASMAFNSAFGAPTAYFRGTNGASSRVGNWFIGDGFGSRTYYTYGACDFNLGTVNALVDIMYVGRGASVAFGAGANNPGFGTLTFGAGNFDVNTLEIGYSTLNAIGTGTVNANGGSLLVNSLLELGHATGSSGALNISNATVTANAGITVGGGTSTVRMTGGTLNVTNLTATIGTTANPLNTFSVTNAVLNLAVQSLTPSVTTANLEADGAANTFNITSVPLLTGFPTQFSLIQYGLNGGSASGNLATFAVGTLPSASPAYDAYISNNVANNSIDIVFTNGPSVPALTWDGATNGNWDTSTSNWRPQTGPDTAYAQGNFVTFDDSLTGIPNVNLTTTLTPGSVTVSNAAVNYIFSGGGSISGSTALVKNGSGTLTLSETGGDNFSGGIIVNNGTLVLNNANGAISGGTTINAGTVQVGNNGTSGSVPLGNITDSGALIFNRANNIIVSNAISGAGTLTQNDTNVVTLSGNSTFGGMATVVQGTLQVGSTNGIGLATSVTVNSNATFDVGGFALFGNGNSTLVVTVSGAGVGGNGAIVNSGGNQSRVFHNVTLAADATFGGNGDWDIRNTTGSSAPADANLNGAFNLTKVGTNSVALRGVAIPSLGDINVQAGSLTITATATAPQTSLGDPNAIATVFSNGTLTLDTIGSVPPKNFVLNNGGTLKSSGTNTLGSPVTLTGAANNTITVNSTAQFTITNALIGGGGFSKNGSGVLFLTTNNSYSGNTVVSGGTLALYGGGSDGSISSSININVTSGSVIDVSGRSNGTLTLANGQTLDGGVGTNGPGAVNGILVSSSGATFAPGTGTTNIGTLSVSSSATLQGTTIMKLNAATSTSDRLYAYAITYGGTLIVTNFSGTITNGQAFQLFVATNGYSANFSSVTLPTATGLTWTNTLTSNGTITAGVVTVNTTPTNMTTVVSGNQLLISWPADHTGWHLQAQTNTLAAGLGTNWVTIPNTDSSNSYTNTINPAQGAVFYRMVYP